MKLGEWIVRFGQQYREYMRELTDAGVQMASDTFNSVDPVYENVDVAVTAQTEDGIDYRIIASGHDAAFIEFGAGVNAGVRRPTVQADFDISPGSWSSSEGGQGEFAKYGSWHHGGHKYFGAPAMGGMQEACNTMQQQSPNIARRVFG